MIRRTGISAILMGFTAPIKDGYRISAIEFGNDVGTGDGETPTSITLDTPDSEFQLLYRANINHDMVRVEDYKRLKFDVNLDDVVINTSSNILHFTSVRLMCASGEVFAWRRFPERIMTVGYRVSMEWDIVLDEVCWNYKPDVGVEYPYVKLLMQGHVEGRENNNWDDFLNGDDATENFVGRGYSADGITWSRDSTDFIPKYGEYTIYTDLQNGDFMWNSDTYGGGFFRTFAHIVKITDGGGYHCLGHGWRHDVYNAITHENDTSMGICDDQPM